MKTLIKTQENKLAHLLFLSAALSIVLSMFYVDEGRYSFEGLLSLEALPVMLLYGMIIFALQAAPFHLTEKWLAFPVRLLISLTFLFLLILAFFLAVS